MAPMAAKSAARPPPIGGWDTRNALADMPPENAVILDNWLPTTDRVKLRKGHTEHATGLGATVESMLGHTSLTGAAKIFGAAGSNIYDVTSSGAVGAAAVTGLTNARFQHVQMGTSGGQFSLGVNGADGVHTYNGSAWSTSSITGPTTANLVWINVHQRRLWFGETGSLSAWYLPVNSISGTASEFPLAGLASEGGYIMAMGTWTRDSGRGTDDVAVFLTSQGQAIVYAGTDPADSTLWGLVGVFKVGKPIGRQCLVKRGGDLVMVTEDGFVAASSILLTDRAATDQVAISRIINKATNDAVQSYGSNFGWQPILYPFGQQLIFNIPIKADNTEAHQYVFNTVAVRTDENGRPYNPGCRFTGQPAVSWGMAGDSIYFGAADSKTYRADFGTSDNGTNICADALQAFDYFGSPGQGKTFTRVEPIFQSVDDPQPAIDVNIDFSIEAPTGVPEAGASDYGLWDTAVWDTDIWGGDATIWKGWRAAGGHGKAASIRVRVDTNIAQPNWVSTNWMWKPGGIV